MTAPREKRLELLLTDLLIAGRHLVRLPTNVGARRQLRAACDRAQAWLKADPGSGSGAGMAAGHAEEAERRRREPPLLRGRLPYKED